MSGQSKPRCSSPTSSIALGFLTASSQTTAPSFGKKFLDFNDNHHIRVLWLAVTHPKTNGQVERTNGMVLQGLKPRIFNRLDKHGKKWAAELPSVLWSLRTTPSRATGFTPFFLVYGAEAMLPTDLEYGSPRLKAYNEQSNDATERTPSTSSRRLEI
jgi:hypothetical protein